MLPSPLLFLENLFVEIEHKVPGFTAGTFPIDHICYRVETEARYAELKAALAKEHSLLAETEVGGRPIATFRLSQPFVFREENIPLLELPMPKTGKFYAEGYEHIEMVIDVDFRTFMRRFPTLEFDTKAINKQVNPEVRVRFASGTVKFHHQSLAEVIRNAKKIDSEF